MRKLLLLAPLVVAAVPGAALAQTSNTSTKNVGVIGTAPAMCFGGTLTGNGSYDLGVLIDTATGQLRTDLSAPPKVLVGSFCTGRSTITVAATPLAAQNSTVAPPSGFSRQVNYTATATGWTVTPASYTTGAATQPAATQTRASAGVVPASAARMKSEIVRMISSPPQWSRSPDRDSCHRRPA